MRTDPRDVGRKLQALKVIAAKRCRGSPNLSNDSGCTWKLDIFALGLSRILGFAHEYAQAAKAPWSWVRDGAAHSRSPCLLAPIASDMRD